MNRAGLRLFLRRTGGWTLLLASAAIAAIVGFREEFATLVFGDAAHAPLLVIVAGCLAAVILHHFLEAVFAGLRLFRVVSAMQFCQSIVFAATALGLISWWRAAADSIVVGYAAGCAVSSIGVLVWSLLFAQHGAPRFRARRRRHCASEVLAAAGALRGRRLGG